MESSNSQSTSPYFDEGVKLISFCPLCEASYNPQEAKVLGETADQHLLFIRCSRCENAIIASVLISAVGVSSIGLVTDLQYEEVHRFRGGSAVSADDVINIHQALENADLFLNDVMLG